MKKLLLLSCLAAAASAIFFPFMTNRQQMVNVCIYSNDPAKYQPKCLTCPNDVYPNVLQTCVNAAALPSNVSYTQARCIEQNCMIRRGGGGFGIGKRSIDDTKLPNQLNDPETVGAEESTKQNAGQKTDQDPKVIIVGTEEVFASDDYTYEDEEAEELDKV